MARPPSPTTMSPPVWSRFRSKEYIFALVAGLLVLVFLFSSREGAESRTASDVQQAIISPPEQEFTTETSQIQPPVSHDQDVPPVRPVQSVAPDSGGNNNNNNDFFASDGLAQAVPKDRPQAVIIETDMISNLIPIMLHFATVLGPAWGMILFTLEDRWTQPLSPAFQRFIDAGRIEVRFLPADTQLSNSQAVSKFLASPWIWEQVQAAKRVLLFQSDSILCSKSEATVEDYFRYDLIGAPIAEQYGQGYNGGLSVRNPRVFLEIAREVDFSTSGHEFEDQFFYGEILKRGGSLAGVEVAKTFSVETIYYETPLGYHQPQRWQPNMMNEIEDWCPEVKMLVGRRAQ
ncbi:hypothetical protein VP1G_10304 [Cytospora mali]|uniref:DUF5672 domain-containing protein n=1 Tax=Cytospora mali TaxID=578113 RepID=A0A194VH32_CYTMA|nr:hypothetical protein VP1G_10304 [Valsa mali var. pyri (nom. inval.)]